MAAPHKHTLTGLNTRDAIADAIYRAVGAYDDNDYNLLTSALTPDAVFIMGDQTMTGLDHIKAQNFDTVSVMETTHFITNVRVDVESDSATTATARCNALSQHYPPGTGASDAERRLLVGGKYRLDLVKDGADGLWKIKKWVLDIVWKEGDYSVFQKETW